MNSCSRGLCGAARTCGFLLLCLSCVAWQAACEEWADVSLQQSYQELALRYLPTLLHETGTACYPTSFTFDGDPDISNNRQNYSSSVFRFVYIHVLRSSTRIAVQYWYYYVDNPWPLTITYQGLRDWSHEINLTQDERALIEEISRDLPAFPCHPHDWELAVIVFDANRMPLSMAVGAHTRLYEIDWHYVHVDGNSQTHPIVYSYAKSHAMYFRPNNPAFWYCYRLPSVSFNIQDREGVWFFRLNSSTIGVEDWKGGGSYSTWEGMTVGGNYMFLGGTIATSSPAKIRVASFCGYTQTGGTVDFPRSFSAGNQVTAPWTRPLWLSVPDVLDGSPY